MNSVQEALRRLELLEQSLRRSSLAIPVDAARECSRLHDVSRDFAARASQPRVLRSSLNPQQVWNEWAADEFNFSRLDARRIETLCLAPEMATRRELIDALRENGEALQRTSCLMGMISSYFTRWEDADHIDTMSSLISKALQNYARRNPLILTYRDEQELLFKRTAASRLGALALDRMESPKTSLSAFHIGLATNLALATLTSATREFISRLSTAGSTGAAEIKLKYAINSLFVPELPIHELHSAVSAIILKDWIDKYPDCRKILQEFVLHHGNLGDPRLRSANWAGMDQAATAKFLKWIAKESITFFFNHILPRNSANERRKNFWLEYLAAVKDFQVALSEADYKKLWASQRLRDVPGFGRVDHDTTSAFIMRFAVRGGEDLVIVEFSETGNASHAFSAPAFVSKAGSLRNSRFAFKKLKHQANENRILHLGAWELYARNKLAGWGVRH